MSVKFDVEARRQSLQSERSFAEMMLGNTYPVRIYARHENVLRGTVTVSDKDSFSVHTAYVICDNYSGNNVTDAKTVGVMIDKVTSSVSLVLAVGEKAEYTWSQHEIAEAVDYWENGKDMRILCLRERSCGAVVYTGDGENRRYLVIRMNLGHCGLPKGHIEKYETEEETAIREVKEETGVEITLVEGFRKSVEYSLSARTRKESVYFLGRFDGDDVKIQEAEVSSYRLCPYEEARRLITYENDRVILDEAEKLISEMEA